MTDDPGPGLIDISDAHHLTSFYVILFYYTTFAQIPVEVVQMISRKPVSAFLRHFQIIRFVIAWWGRAGSDFL